MEKSFCWPALWGGPLWYLWKGLYGQALFWAVLCPLTFGLSWGVAPFFAHEELEARRTGRPGRAVDILAIGVLLILTGILDLYMIMSYPGYQLKVFGTTFSGLVGWAVKLQSPVMHIMLGFGFLALKPWALWLFVAYMLYGVTNASINYAVFGFGVFRTMFLCGAFLALVYILARRESFQAGSWRRLPVSRDVREGVL